MKFQRKYLVLALMAALTSVSQHSVAAEETPAYKIYGVLDVSVSRQDSGYGNKLRFDGGGGKDPSRLGVLINKQFDSGYKAVGKLEAGLQINDGAMGGTANTNGLNVTTPSSGGNPAAANQIFSREAWAGLGGKFGQATLGKQYTGSYFGAAAVGTAYAGFYNTSAAMLPLIGGMPTRVNNSLIWKSPVVNGFSTTITALAGSENNVKVPTVTASGATTSTTDAAGKGSDLALFYSNGPANMAVTTWNVNNTSYVTATETGLAKKSGYMLAGNYDFNSFKLYGTYVNGKIQGGNYETITKTLSSASGYGLSVKVPFGSDALFTTYTKLNDDSALQKSATFASVSYMHTLDKDLSVYTSYGMTSNNANASYQMYDGANLMGDTAAAGTKVKGLMVGLNYWF